MTTPGANGPDWDLSQLEVIIEPSSTWQLVVAGPGAGKSAVACQRVAFLIDEGTPPSRILLISFTRTAVAELRNRIIEYAVAGDRARSTRISTLDSHAWSLRSGFDDNIAKRSLDGDSYDLSIGQTVALLREGQPDLCDFVSQLEHLIVDEAQDILGIRADLIIEMLRKLADGCGVTILADPAQAIYGFTAETGDTARIEPSLLTRLETDSARPFLRRQLNHVHRVNDSILTELFLRTRKEIELCDDTSGYVARIQQSIRDTCGNDVGVQSYSTLPTFLAHASDESMLVLFRRRADVLIASSYCSQAGIAHRLRMSDVPIVVHPWIGWLFSEVVQTLISRSEFDNLWHARHELASQPFEGARRDDAWAMLHRLSAGHRLGTLDLDHLRQLLIRTRPPFDLCYPDLGSTGPILGTIHASKGREADTVVLVMPSHDERTGDDVNPRKDSLFEEGRVYYVGATRARRKLMVAAGVPTPVGYLDSRRVYRLLGSTKVQLEIGRLEDVDRMAHLAWDNCHDVQQALASSVGTTAKVQAYTRPEDGYSLRLILEQRSPDNIARYVEIGQLSDSFRVDLGHLWRKVDSHQNLKPSDKIPHLYLIGVTTVAFSEEQRAALRPPFSRSGLALAPIIKGFPAIHFFYRRSGGNRR